MPQSIWWPALKLLSGGFLVFYDVRAVLPLSPSSDLPTACGGSYKRRSAYQV